MSGPNPSIPSMALARFIYTGKLRLSQTQQGDVCFLMGLLRAADQFCVAAQGVPSQVIEMMVLIDRLELQKTSRDCYKTHP